MIRAAIVSVLFMASVLVLLAMQPGVGRQAADRKGTGTNIPSVTRADTEIDTYADLSESISLLSSTVEQQTHLPERITVPVGAQAMLRDNVAISARNAAQQPDTATAGTDNVQAASMPRATDAAELERLIVTALTQGQSEAYIDALVKEAARQGGLAIPDTLMTEDGRVDTASLLSALQVGGLAAGMNETYEIRPGDSLKSISYRFFGSTIYATEIFEANRDVLSSPTQLSVGTQIVIPAF